MYRLNAKLCCKGYRHLKGFVFDRINLGAYRVVSHPSFIVPPAEQTLPNDSAPDTRRYKKNELVGAIYNFDDQIQEVMEEISK
jgi:hypothetical protein